MTDTRTPNDPGAQGKSKKLLALATSARRESNSRKLAQAVLDGALEAGHTGELIHIADHVTGLFRNCRECRNAEGQCTIGDGYEEILLEKFLPADGIVWGTPIYWYGYSAHMKNFVDRLFCYIVEGYPGSRAVIDGLMDKKVALVMAAEENNFSCRLANVQEMTQMCDYLHHEFIGIVQTVANSRKDVANDPNRPIEVARDLGRSFFEIHENNYRLEIPRDDVIWQGEKSQYRRPAVWR